MPRAKTRVASRDRRKKVLKSTKGYFGKKKSCITIAKDAMYRSGVFAYRDRKQNKRNFRALWIMRINAAARLNGTTYGRLIDALSKKGMDLNRKSLAHLATNEPDAFKKLVEQVIA